MDLALRTPADVGAVIRARRKALGWGQATLAEAVGVSRLWVNQVEGGKPGASLSLVLKTLDVLGLTLTAKERDAANTAVDPTPIRQFDLDAIIENARRKYDQ